MLDFFFFNIMLPILLHQILLPCNVSSFILASFGGLLGLIMGFSIVTAFEFIYFLTFRPIFNYFNDA